jgi:hypothetical protein
MNGEPPSLKVGTPMSSDREKMWQDRWYNLYSSLREIVESRRVGEQPSSEQLIARRALAKDRSGGYY